MKPIQIKLLKKYNAILASLLALIGFASSCEKDGPRVEYGTPSAKFIVNGAITSKETQQGIKDLRVVMQSDTVTTDTDGSYQVETVDFPMDQTFHVIITDMDGTLNEEFNELDTVVNFTNPTFENGDGHWYQGETSKGFNIQLVPKK